MQWRKGRNDLKNIHQNLLLYHRVAKKFRTAHGPKDRIGSLVALNHNIIAAIRIEIADLYANDARTVVLKTNDVIKHFGIDGVSPSSRLHIETRTP